MTYSDDYNIRTTQVKFNDVAEAIDGVLTRNNGGTTAGSNTVYTALPVPAWSDVDTGAFIIVIPHTNNGANPTLNVSDTGSYPILQNGAAVETGKFLAGVPQLLLFNGTGWEIVAGGSLQPTVLAPITLDQTNYRVGINQTVPLTTLHLKQAAPIIRLEDTDGGYADISGDGGNGSLTFKADEANTGLNTSISFRIDGAERANISYGGAFSANNISLSNGSTGTAVIVGKGAPSQSANLLELQNSSGTNQLSVDPSGNASLAALTATSKAAGTIAITGKGAVGQTANLLNLTNSSNVSQCSVSAAGLLSAMNGSFTGDVTSATGTFTTSVTTPTLASASGTISTANNLTVSNVGGSAQLNANFVVTKRVTGASAGDLSLVAIGTLVHNCDNGYRFLNLITGTGTAAYFDSGGYLVKFSSSLRFKKDVEPLEFKYSQNVLNLEPKWFRLKEDPKNLPKNWGYFGLIAEEVAQIEPRLVSWGFLPEDLDEETGDPKPNAELVPESVNYQLISVLLIDQVKLLRKELDELKAKVG